MITVATIFRVTWNWALISIVCNCCCFCCFGFLQPVAKWPSSPLLQHWVLFPAFCCWLSLFGAVHWSVFELPWFLLKHYEAYYPCLPHRLQVTEVCALGWALGVLDWPAWLWMLFRFRSVYGCLVALLQSIVSWLYMLQFWPVVFWLWLGLVTLGVLGFLSGVASCFLLHSSFEWFFILQHIQYFLALFYFWCPWWWNF